MTCLLGGGGAGLNEPFVYVHTQCAVFLRGWVFHGIVRIVYMSLWSCKFGKWCLVVKYD